MISRRLEISSPDSSSRDSTQALLPPDNVVSVICLLLFSFFRVFSFSLPYEPQNAASCKGLPPSFSTRLGSAPASNNALTALMCPYHTASWSGLRLWPQSPQNNVSLALWWTDTKAFIESPPVRPYRAAARRKEMRILSGRTTHVKGAYRSAEACDPNDQQDMETPRRREVS